MKLQTIALQHFRNYENKMFSFEQTTTLIVGPNGTGKTNILEGLMLLATGKSFRAHVDREMVQWDKAFGRVKANLFDTKLEILLTETKKYLVNGISRRQIDFVGNFRAVLFWPEDLALVTHSPSLRRKFLDNVLIQVDREYRRNVLSYERGLRQRNKLLDLINDNRAHRHQLTFWNQLLIRSGNYITEKRATFISFINSTNLQDHAFMIEYDKSVINEARLEQYKNEEVAAKATLVGPHRDDFIFHFEEKDLSKFGSRGEQRLSVLWLKLAELSYIEKETGDRPLLLLDDILSELDPAHKAIVISVLDDQQTILTSADPSIMQTVGKRNVHTISL